MAVGCLSQGWAVRALGVLSVVFAVTDKNAHVRQRICIASRGVSYDEDCAYPADLVELEGQFEDLVGELSLVRKVARVFVVALISIS